MEARVQKGQNKGNLCLCLPVKMEVIRKLCASCILYGSEMTSKKELVGILLGEMGIFRWMYSVNLWVHV